MAFQIVVGSGSAPQLIEITGPSRRSTAAVRSPAGVEKVTRPASSARRRRSPTRSHPIDVRTAISAACTGAGRSSGRGRGRAGSGRLEQRCGHLAGALEGDPPELDARGQDEDVRREAVPAEMRRLPEPLGRRRRLQWPRRTGARGARSTRRGGRGRRRGRSGRRSARPARRGRGPAARRASRARDGRGSPALVGACVDDVDAVATVGSPDQEHLAVERRERILDGFGRGRCRRPHPGPTIPAPRRGASSTASVAVPASGSPAASDAAEQVAAGSVSASDLTPAAGRRAAVRGRDRSRARRRRPGTRRAPSPCRGPGRATARSSTFFGVCSSSTNSSTWTS